MTDSNQAKVPATLAERARARVQEALADIYTDEELDKMVRQEIDAFFTKPSERFATCQKRRKNEDWNNPTIDYWTEQVECKLSPFQLIIWNMCATLVMNKLVETKNDPVLGITTIMESVNRPDGSMGTPIETKQMGEEIQKRAEKMAAEFAPKMFAYMFAGMMEQSRDQMMMEFQSRLGMPNY